MLHKALVLKRLLLVCLTVAFGWLSQSALAQTASLADSMHSGAIAYAELSGLESVIDGVHRSEFLDMLLASQPYQAVLETPQYRKIQAGRQILETQLETDLWTLGKKLLGGQVAAALYPHPGNEQPDVVLVIRPADPKVLAHVRARIEPLLVLAEDHIERTEAENGVELFSANDDVFVGLHDAWVVAANNRELLAKTLVLLTGQGQNPLSADESFVAMARQMGTDHSGRVYINTSAIAAATGGRLGLPSKLDNPLGSLLFGGIFEMIVRSPYAGFTLDIEDRQFVLQAGVKGDYSSLGESYEAFFSEFPESGTRPIPHPADAIGGFTIYRDFAAWYDRREELLQADVLPGFDKFEAGLGNLLPGKDFSEDVLPLIGKNITFVSAPQDYSHLAGTPGVKLPGFAVIVDLAKPAEGAEIFQLFFQTFSAILNIQAGQQGRQPWLLKSDVYQDVTVNFGYYLQKPEGSRLPLVFNFTPASARLEDKFIISSSVGLCKQLIDELKDPASGERVNKNLNVELNVGPLVDILATNRETFQAQRIQQGRTPEEAQQDVDTFSKLLRYVESLALSTTVSKESFQARLKGTWK